VRILLWTMLLALTAVASGCGDGRPDPRTNPNFNEASANDASKADLPPAPGQAEKPNQPKRP
jgi:hypothetical protein